jgi:membrane fusion protein (multidrug efflux system)
MLKFNSKGQVILIVLLTGFLIGGCKDKGPKVMAARGAVGVEIVTLKTQPTQLEVELPGRTTAYRVAEVRPQVNGIVKERLLY